MRGAFCYKRVAFGICSGPLVWGRVAALLMRITAVLHHEETDEVECFVDDPLFFFGGTPSERDRLFLRTVVLWLALGFQVAWRKGSRGRHIEWIGAVIKEWTSHPGVPGVTISITADRILRLMDDCKALLTEGSRVQKRKIRRVARLASWVAGVMPSISAFATRLWAAANVGEAETASLEHVKTALFWLLTLCHDTLSGVERHCRERAKFFNLITFDGLLTSGGATCRFGCSH